MRTTITRIRLRPETRERFRDIVDSLAALEPVDSVASRVGYDPHVVKLFGRRHRVPCVLLSADIVNRIKALDPGGCAIVPTDNFDALKIRLREYGRLVGKWFVSRKISSGARIVRLG